MLFKLILRSLIISFYTCYDANTPMKAFWLFIGI